MTRASHARIERRKKARKIGVIDFETDPFRFGRIPKPFAVEFLSENESATFWGDDCADRLADYLDALPEPYTIFAHNGGKFDFWFLHRYISNPIAVINARIVSAKLFHHTLRDSFAIIPVGLAAYNKIEIDYRKFERRLREKHKPEICRYLHQDCSDLLTLVLSFVERFGLKLTVASTAMTEICKFHEFDRITQARDELFRPYYFGGRVEAYRSGIIKGPWKVYDLNSSYPKSMRDFNHPTTDSWDMSDKIPRSFKRPFFVKFIGRNRGALPRRKDNDEGLTFNCPEGEFFACSHELELALDLGLVKIDKVLEVYRANEFMRFDSFVDHFYSEKVAAKTSGDKVGELFAKFMLNSGYGKFGQSPDRYKDWRICHDIDDEAEAEDMGYSMESDFGEFLLYSRPAFVRDSSFYNVSIAASITSASRAQLLSGLQDAIDPIYCDTDSIICRGFKGDVSETVLGAWKLERSNTWAAIAGKKLYALYNSPGDAFNVKGAPAKVVSKGGTLTLPELLSVARGGTVHYENKAPTFSMHPGANSDRLAKFISRDFRRTVELD